MAAAILHVVQHQQARQQRKPRLFRKRVHPLEEYEDEEVIRKKYRLTKDLILDLYDEIGEDLEPETSRNHAVKGIDKLLCALRFYATGSFQDTVGEGFGVHRSTVSRIITKVTDSICRLRHRYIKFPQGRDEAQRTKRQFHAIDGFPNVLGAIDGSLIAIKTPSEDEPNYVSGRKTGHHLNVLAVCSANLEFTYIVAKFPGSSNDAYIWNNSGLCRKFQQGRMPEGWLIGDSGYVLPQFSN